MLNHNRTEAYLVPAAYFERMLQHLQDLEDAKLALLAEGESAKQYSAKVRTRPQSLSKTTG